MANVRPNRVSRVVYKELESDEELEEDFGYLDEIDEETRNLYKKLFPPLTPLQLELRQLCRSGNLVGVKDFLANNPDIDLNVKDPEGGTTALNEVATKTAQFTEIVELLVNAGAGLDVTDSLGNTPLHNAVLYYPSTQRTVDLLLEKGSDVKAMNYEGSTPLTLADDKDLKAVLKQLKKVAEKKNPGPKDVSYTGSPDMRKKVLNKNLEEFESKSITVRFNSPRSESKGLLKRKRDDPDDENIGPVVKKKRIRFCEQDSTGANIDPQFSDGEDAQSLDDAEASTSFSSDTASHSESLVNEIENGESDTTKDITIGPPAVTLKLSKSSLHDSPDLPEVESTSSQPKENVPVLKSIQSAITRYFLPNLKKSTSNSEA